MADDVSVTFGASVAGLDAGVKQVASSITGLKSNVAALGGQFSELGDLTARQVGSVTNLFNRLGSAVGVSLGPIGILSTELVRAGQHFKEFETAGQALEAIGATLFEAITNPLTIAIGAIAGTVIAFGLLTKAVEGPNLEETLKRHLQLIKDIQAAYGAAAKAATDYSEKSASALKLQNEQITQELRQELNAQLGAFEISVEQGTLALADAFGVNGPLPAAVEKFRRDIASGTADVLAFREEIRNLALAAPANSPLRDFLEEVLRLTDKAAQAAAALKNELGAAAVLQSATVGTLVPGFAGFSDWDQADAIKKLIDELKKLQAPQLAIDMKDARERIQEVNAQLQDALRAQKAVQAQWEGFFTNIVGGFDRAFSGLLNHTMTWKQAMFQVFDSLWQEFVKIVEKMVVEWLTGEAMKLKATEAGVAAQTAVQAAGQTAQTAVVFGEIIKTILADAKAVFGGIFAFLSPAMGPAAAGPAAAGAASVSAAAGAVASFDVGSWSLPHDMVAQVHQGEMIVPAQGGIADTLRSMLSGGGGGDVEDIVERLFQRFFPQFRQMSGSSNRLANTVADAMKRFR
jgi:hypothetical protein